MKILVFSDVHGNKYAFDKFILKLNEIEYNKIIFCGDIFGYYYDQLYIIDQLKRIENLIWLKGNHDDYAVKLYKGLISERDLIERYGHSYQYLMNYLSDSDIDFIDNLPIYKKLEVSGKKIGVFHGTPDDYLMGRLYPNDKILDGDSYLYYDIVILGHTHFKMVRYIQNTMIINPGSLGQPRDGRGFGYAVIDFEVNEVLFYNVDFDKTELYKKINYYDSKLNKLKWILEREEVNS